MKYDKKHSKEISFPLGGIGTGSIGLAGNGRLVDWEMFNRPSKGSLNGNSHFAIKAKKGAKSVAYVLNGDLDSDYIGQRPYSYGSGPDSHTLCGFPHFANCEFDGEFPEAVISFSDDNFPANVKLRAFNPLIPNDAENSSIPAAFFEIEVENTTDEPIEYHIAFSVANPYNVSKNTYCEKDGVGMLVMSNGGAEPNSTEYGDLTVATDCDKRLVQTYWYRGNWMDGIVSFWNDITAEDDLKDRIYNENGKNDMGTLAAVVNANPHESVKARFVLSWNVPNSYNYWSEYKDSDGKDVIWKNYYATVFEDSQESAMYSLKNWDMLYERTTKFKKELYSSTFPKEVIDAAAANLSVLKSPTVLRLEDGTFWGWEGVFSNAGSCEGTCQHVWNYAYALCFLFPELERSIRNAEFKYSTAPDGRMGFRMMLPLGRKMTDFRACVDGQMGSVIKCYREWKLSGDNKWLAENWESIKNVLEYAWSESNPDKWDFDKDGVLEGRQHHTLDMELFGPSSWLEGMYLAALRAAAEMAEFLGDAEKAHEYNELFEKGRKWTAENLFNGKYFIQKIDLTDKSITDAFDASESYWNDEAKQIKYQIGEGSSIDQMLAQWHADILGLGDIFDKEQIDAALGEMVKNNYKPSMRGFANPWRVFSLNDEAGSVICEYPSDAEKPRIPIPYYTETMTGFEYSFAGLLCSRGRVEDGLNAVKAVRDRFDGEKRNPWNEFECGNNYARSMASYALIPILSGFEFDLPHKHLGFAPYKSGDFKTVWSVGGAHGTFEKTGNRIRFSVTEGETELISFGLKNERCVTEVTADGEPVKFKFEDGKLHFDSRKICKEMIIITR